MNAEVIAEIESFVNSFGYFYVDERGEYIQIKGTFDDLSPEPERSEVDESLHQMRRAIMNSDEFPIEVEKVSNVNGRYGAKYIRVYPVDSEA